MGGWQRRGLSTFSQWSDTPWRGRLAARHRSFAEFSEGSARTGGSGDRERRRAYPIPEALDDPCVTKGWSVLVGGSTMRKEVQAARGEQPVIRSVDDSRKELGRQPDCRQADTRSATALRGGTVNGRLGRRLESNSSVTVSTAACARTSPRRRDRGAKGLHAAVHECSRRRPRSAVSGPSDKPVRFKDGLVRPERRVAATR